MVTAHEHATSAAENLLRVAMIAKLATDLGDPQLARRAARYATDSARLLARLDWQPLPGVLGADDGAPMPEVDALLARLRPAPITDDDRSTP